jgi:hypothetical protein
MEASGAVGQLLMLWTVIENKLAGTAPNTGGGGEVLELPPPQLRVHRQRRSVARKKMRDRWNNDGSFLFLVS